jgi:hypothetical protein
VEERTMKKLILLVAAALGVAWAVNQKKAAAEKPADPWAEASDPV